MRILTCACGIANAAARASSNADAVSKESATSSLHAAFSGFASLKSVTCTVKPRSVLLCLLFAPRGRSPDVARIWRQLSRAGDRISSGRNQLDARFYSEGALCEDRHSRGASGVGEGDPDQIPCSRHSSLAVTIELGSIITTVKHQTWEYKREVRLVFQQSRTRHDGFYKWPDGTKIFWEPPLRRVRGAERIEYKAFPFAGRGPAGARSRAIAAVVVGPSCGLATDDVKSELRKRIR